MELQKIYTEGKNPLCAFAESRVGGRSENQDNFGWLDTSIGYVVTVCDGMGGGPGGKTASTIAVNEILAGIAEASQDEDVQNIIIKAIRKANMAIIEAGNRNKALKGMGSTATVLLVSEKSAFIAHVGDSRVYQLRGHRKVFRTFDHSMVFEMVEQGVITEEQARLSAQSNVITRALGVKPDVEVEIHEVAYEKGDRFMLCSDGIHGALPEKDLLKMATNRSRKLGVITDDIATCIDNIGRSSGGGHDNLTLAIVETSINSKLKPKMSKQVKTLLTGLVALVVISCSLNVVQYVNRPNQRNKTNLEDSLKSQQEIIALKSDTIANLKDTIANLKENAKKDDLDKMNKTKKTVRNR